MSERPRLLPHERPTLVNRAIRFCLENKLVVGLAAAFLVAWGVVVAPFDWDIPLLPRRPIPTDAIPDIGENQQIVFTEWPGRSAQDVQDQVTYPLTAALQGISGVKTVRSSSMFGFSSVYVIFDESVEFYWSRSRILEKLASLPPGTLPPNVMPMLGPDATALGQVFWYTLEGRDERGEPTGGWDLQELRSIQDWDVRYALASAEGVSEVASVGGFVKEYQVDADPDAMRASRVSLDMIAEAISASNVDVGARTIEVNGVEYVVRGVGFIKGLRDVEDAVVAVNGNVPIFVRNVARVSLGPALRVGALDKAGAEAAGGVVIVRHKANPLSTIANVKRKIEELSPGLPRKVLIDFEKVSRAEAERFARERGFEAWAGPVLDQKAWLGWLKTAPPGSLPEWAVLSQVKIVPFHDRTGLINETLGTLNDAILEQVLVTVIVVLVMVMHLRSSILISALLPMAILMCFITMKLAGVDANIVALSGIAIAIGTLVDMGIVICENILKHLDEADPAEDRLEVVYRAASEVGGAVVSAVASTIVSFLPVFALQASEGRMFRPLAFTKTFALLASVVVAITMIPAFAHLLFAGRARGWLLRTLLHGGLAAAGVALAVAVSWWMGLIVAGIGAYHLAEARLPERARAWARRSANWIAAAAVALLLTSHWLPLGPDKGLWLNLAFVGMLVGGLLGFYLLFQHFYGSILRWCLAHKLAFLSIPAAILVMGAFAWLGFERVLGWLPDRAKAFGPVSAVAHRFPGLGNEFMPPLDEGSFLYMPTTMPHAGVGEALDILRKQDAAIDRVPEVDSVVGKIGRAETAIDPAPMSMVETVINYKPEYLSDRAGRRLAFSFEPDAQDYFRNEEGVPVAAPDGQPYIVRGRFPRDSIGRLIPERGGRPFRLWRPALDPALNPGRTAWPGIRSPDDIWNRIVAAADVPGSTSAPKLQPIAARIVMLQSGIRAQMGVRIQGPDLETVEKAGLEIERLLKEVPSVEPSTVFADRITGKAYLNIVPDRQAIGRYGIRLGDVQRVIETALGGDRITTTVEGRERYPVRVRYLRELRDSFEELGRILVPAPDASQIPLAQLARIDYARSPEVIRTEDTFLVGYVLFDMKPGNAEVDVVAACRRHLEERLAPAEGVKWTFTGSYESQQRAAATLRLIVPVSLFSIFLILYFQFRSVATSLLVFAGVAVSWAGGFVMVWLCSQAWFMNFALFGADMRELFHIHPVNMSVAVWVGFLALFGISDDDGVVIATYLDDSFGRRRPSTVPELREATVAAGKRRIRACLMTTATTVLALLPVFTSTGRGSDLMAPMAIPAFGGMAFEVITMLIVPVLYCLVAEIRLSTRK